MEYQKFRQRFPHLSFVALMSFLVSFAFCVFLISTTIINKTNLSKIRIEQQIYERSHRINENITKLLYKTQSLAAIVVHGQGDIDSFDLIAPSIVDDPAIQNVLMAPDGIITKIYPMAGNEDNLGWNYFDGRQGNREAIIARELGELVLAGPFDRNFGGMLLAGRLPVYIDTPEDGHKFWGIVSVTLKLSQILEKAELDIFNAFGYSYELWRIDPDTNERQVISSRIHHSDPNVKYIEKPVRILNAEWFLRVSPINNWYSYPENIVLVLAGFCICFIVFFVMQHNYELKRMQKVFETMAITDPLTGIFNRRHFLEIARISVEKARRYKEPCYFIMFDIDKFKSVNDTYGHQIGDKVLMDVAARIKSDIRPYDLFARYGGEEFIVFTYGISKKEVCEMVERLRVSLCSRKYEYDHVSIESSASFGISSMEDYNIDKAIKQSDEALYAAKRNGRNCFVYYGDG